MSTDVSEVRAASIIALMMEAARTSETSVDLQLRTWQYILEDSELLDLSGSGRGGGQWQAFVNTVMNVPVPWA
jgi:hypothetical protein